MSLIYFGLQTQHFLNYYKEHTFLKKSEVALLKVTYNINFYHLKSLSNQNK